MVAAACGMSLAVNGDAFIARTFDDENNFERKDFTYVVCLEHTSALRERRGCCLCLCVAIVHN
eukprot:SAG31_NODE_927_length_10930_cov_15.134983_9_plen_63_part_00